MCQVCERMFTAKTILCIQSAQRLMLGKPRVDHGWSWVMFICVCLIMFLVFGVHYTFGVFFPALLREFKEGEGKTAWIGSFASGMLFLGSVPAIKLCERTSVSTTCLIGALLCGTGLILTSVTQSFYWLYATHGCMFGLGSSFLYTPVLVMLARWFKKYQSLTTGIAVASASLGSVALAPTIQYSVGQIGLRKTIQCGGVSFLCLCVVCSLSFIPLQRDVQRCAKATAKKEEHSRKNGESGRETLGKLLATAGSNDEPSGTVEKETHARAVKQPTPNESYGFQLNFNLFKKKDYLMFLLIMMITNFTYYIPITHLVNYAEGFGTSPGNASLLITIWSLCNIAGRTLFGHFLTYRRHWLMHIYQVSMFFSGLSTIVASVAENYYLLVTYVVTYGFLDGSFIGLLSLVTLEIVGIEDLGQGYGIMLFAIGVPIALGPPTIGWINDSNLLAPRSMFIIAGVPFVIGSLLMALLIKWRKCRLNEERNNHTIVGDDDRGNGYERNSLLQVVSSL